MRFYAIDPELERAVAGGEAARLRIEIDYGRNGEYQAVREGDILEAEFESRRENAGGVSARGTVLLDNRLGTYGSAEEHNGAGVPVYVSFSAGYGKPFAGRFSFYITEKGFTDIRGPGRMRQIRINLEDYSYQLRRTDQARDWRSPVTIVYTTLCDTANPETSLLHRAAARAGLGPADIACKDIPYRLPYVRLEGNLWDELSDMARAYRAHLEAGVEKPLVFIRSPYQGEVEERPDISYVLDRTNLFELTTASGYSRYRNTVRVKFNLPTVLEKQEIWRYRDGPELYDSAMRAYYPFRASAKRAVEEDGYVAKYRGQEAAGAYREVVYADQVDTFEEARERLSYDGGPVYYNRYDSLSYRDRAILSLKAGTDADLYTATIHGRPIVLERNTGHYARAEAEIERHGTRALNATSHYFSADPVPGGLPQYVDWAERELAERLRPKRRFAAKTNRALFHARVGARVGIDAGRIETVAVIAAMRLCYTKGSAFVSSFQLEEE